MTKQNGIFEKQMRAWVRALSPEGRAAALSVQDSAFMFTLMHFASLSSSCENCSDNGAVAGIDGATCFEISSECSWRQEFLISDIEIIYNMYGERVAKESSLSTNLPAGAPLSSSPATRSKSLVTCLETSKADDDDDGQPSHLSSRQLSKASDSIVGENDEERIQRRSIGSDAFSIQRETNIPSCAESNGTAAFAVANDDFSKSTGKLLCKEDIFKHLLLIFPSVISAAKERGLRCQLGSPKQGDNAVPILSLPPLVAKAFDLDILPPEVLGRIDTSSWINVLRVHAENNSSTNDALKASLFFMMLSRMQVSLTESFISHKYGSLITTSDGEEEQSSVEQYTTSREDEESDEVEADECGADIPEILSHASSNRVPRKARNQTSSNTDDRGRNDSTEIRVGGPPFPSVFRLSEVINEVTIASDLEELQLVPAGSLPFVPFECAIRYGNVEMTRVDAALEKFLSLALPNVEDSSALADVTVRAHDRDVTDVVVVPVTNEGDADSANLEDWQHSSALKKKKKKKKKRRKVSNADSTHGKESTPHVPIRPVSASSIPMRTSIKVAKESIASDVTITSGTSEKTELDDNMKRQCKGKIESGTVADTEFSSSVLPKEDTSTSCVDVPQRLTAEPEFVIVPPSVEHSSNRSKNDSPAVAEGDAEDDDAWETVEAKGKGKNRNKPSDSRVRSNHASNWRLNSGTSRKVKTVRTAASRKRHAARRVVRDVLTSLLDSVELEARRCRVASETKTPEDRSCRVSQPVQQAGPSVSPVTCQPTLPLNPISMRDVVLGKQRTAAAKGTSVQSLPPVAKQDSSAPCNVGDAFQEEHKVVAAVEVRSKGTQTISAAADRSTAPTLPETVSGASANTQSSLATDEVDNLPDRVRLTGADLVADDSSSAAAGGDEVESNNTKVPASTEDESSPPLSTLLGPGNTNSATSSVASSLEAPHTSKHRHHHHHSCNENDVGYHLLDVCDRLSRDMNVFMARRSLALSSRRRERGALLSALQDTVSKIWANHGHVEMYGSCATHLDLPSSDLDAVILGLNASHDVNSSVSKVSMKKQSHRESFTNIDSNSITLASQPRSHYGHHQSSHMYPYGRLSSNGERVMILAAELERQAWAVQVKAIPTASVPVVKILADPSKIPGADGVVGSGGNWMIQQHHLAADAAAAGIKPPPSPSSHTSRVAPVPQGQSPYPPWRGADVMNGLFSIDITFEGPEHGGIGSTKYSAAVVQDACRETGMPPEGTPLVQVLMVLKELLAQRRLNEPFSGGLSSYALLLLVNAVVKERAIIREEMERIERHRELVAAEDTAILTRHFEEVEDGTVKACNDRPGKRKVNAKSANITKQSTTEHSPGQLRKKNEKQNEILLLVPSNDTSVGSSWAAIAKKSTSSRPPGHAIPASTPKKPLALHGPQSPPSFAEAVTRNQQSSLRHGSQRKHTTTNDPNQEKQPVPYEAITEGNRTSKIEEVPKAVAEHGSRPSISTADLASVPSPSQASIQFSPQHLSHHPIKQGVVHLKKTAVPSLDASLSGAPSLFPQGSDDVLEVLCSGETTAGKLLLHFLLYYGEHFDSRALAIDVIGNCYPDHVYGFKPPNVHTSPFIPRRAGGTIDPVTGMLTVDPIVVYDPWEGGRGSNVARSCYAWSSIQWHFAQCYMTLSSAIERCGTSIATPALESSATRRASIDETRRVENTRRPGDSRMNYSAADNKKAGPPPPPVDVVSPLLELLLSF